MPTLEEDGAFSVQQGTPYVHVDDDEAEEAQLLPDASWIAIVCGVPKEWGREHGEELPEGFYVAPKDVYMPGNLFCRCYDGVLMAWVRFDRGCGCATGQAGQSSPKGRSLPALMSTAGLRHGVRMRRCVYALRLWYTPHIRHRRALTTNSQFPVLCS